jgi:hypothetical protein
VIKGKEHRSAEQVRSMVSLIQLPPKDSTEKGSQKLKTSSRLTGMGITLAVNWELVNQWNTMTKDTNLKRSGKIVRLS